MGTKQLSVECVVPCHLVGLSGLPGQAGRAARIFSQLAALAQSNTCRWAPTAVSHFMDEEVAVQSSLCQSWSFTLVWLLPELRLLWG